MPNLTGPTALVIILIVLLLFGAPKLPALARSLGQSMKILKKEVTSNDDGQASGEAETSSASAAPATPAAAEATAAASPDVDELARAKAEAAAAKAEADALRAAAQQRDTDDKA
ncbi:MAG: hypothetical protein GX862_01125 [Leucobacter sp.]|nr:hypothetical protein [Leucobacter sp.]